MQKKISEYDVIIEGSIAEVYISKEEAQQEAVPQDAGSVDIQDSDDMISNPPIELKPKIALTFDDGPHAIYTAKLLDGLLERGVKATFFVVGKNIEGNEELIKRMADEGHLIGNHTYDHVRISNLSDEEVTEQLAKTSELIESITGESTQYIRPPFGAGVPSFQGDLPLISVLWSVDPLDWTTRNVSQVINKVVTKVKENDIILLHDYYSSSVEAALEIIDELQRQGYEFVTVDKLILE